MDCAPRHPPAARFGSTQASSRYWAISSRPLHVSMYRTAAKPQPPPGHLGLDFEPATTRWLNVIMTALTILMAAPLVVEIWRTARSWLSW